MRNQENLKMGKSGKWENSKLGNLAVSKFGKSGKWENLENKECRNFED